MKLQAWIASLIFLSMGCVTAAPDAWRSVDARRSEQPVTTYALGRVTVEGGNLFFGSDGTGALKTAIERTLRDSNLFSPGGQTRANVHANVTGFSRPLMSMGAFTSSLTVHYTLTDDAGTVIFDDVIRSGGADDTGSGLGPVRASRAKTLSVADSVYEPRARLEPTLIAKAPLRPQQPPTVVAAVPPQRQTPRTETPLEAGDEGEILVPLSRQSLAKLPPGDYHALVIGNNAYSDMPRLRTAANDAREVSRVLRQSYGFEVTTLIDATRGDILKSLSTLRGKLGQSDNLLIYYAGHGWFDEGTRRGYWLPVDSSREDPSNWVSAADVTDAVRAMQANHVMIVADSCYSGALTRGVKLQKRDPGYVERLRAKRARVVMTSGGLEPVEDGAGKHSVFAKAFIDTLEDNNGVLEGVALFSQIRRPVILEAEQTPEYGDIRFAGHQGGDFLFIKNE